MNIPIKIGVADDHKLFRRCLIDMITSFDSNYKISIEARNGKELLTLLENKESIDILLLDANMPIMDGFETAEVLKEKYPEIKTLIVSMDNDDESIIRMLRLGVRGYVNKDIDPDELKEAILSISNKGVYYNDHLTGKLIRSLQVFDTNNINIELSEQEEKFIQLACSEYTYKEIADLMCKSPKTIENYRSSVFEKFSLKSRVGLAMYAIKNGLVKI